MDERGVVPDCVPAAGDAIVGLDPDPVVSKYWPKGSRRLRMYAPNWPSAQALQTRAESSILDGTIRQLKQELASGSRTILTVWSFYKRFFEEYCQPRIRSLRRYALSFKGLNAMLAFREDVKQVVRVFKFLPQEWALDDIKKQHIKISRIYDLNDPFDLVPFDLTGSEHRKKLRSARDVLARNRGVVCFSFNWSNPVLWAHYADKHRGVCLGFDVPREYVQAVRYVGKRLPFPTTKPNEQVGRDWVFTKFSGWSYEEECRIFAKLEREENGHFFLDIKKNNVTLREVILGCRCQLDPTCILALLEPYVEDVSVIKARLSNSSFDMVKNH